MPLLRHRPAPFHRGVYNGVDDRQQALTYYQQALPTLREVGDRVGEAVTRYNIAMLEQVRRERAQTQG